MQREGVGGHCENMVHVIVTQLLQETRLKTDTDILVHTFHADKENIFHFFGEEAVTQITNRMTVD